MGPFDTLKHVDQEVKDLPARVKAMLDEPPPWYAEFRNLKNLQDSGAKLSPRIEARLAELEATFKESQKQPAWTEEAPAPLPVAAER